MHAHGLTVGWWASLVPRRPPLVVTVHNVVLDEVAGWRAPLLRRLERRLPARVDAVIATSPAVAGRHRSASAAVVAPFGPAPVAARTPRRGAPGVGRARPARRWWRPSAASTPRRASTACSTPCALARRPRARRAAWCWWGRARSRATSAGASPPRASPTGSGWSGRPTTPPPPCVAADVVAVPSVWESGPLVVAEAMELGRPVVATPVGFVPELVTDGETGRLVGPGDAGALAGGPRRPARWPRTAPRALGRRRSPPVAAWQDRAGAVAAVVAVYESVRRRP